jgi:hypothetical protein
MEVKSMHHKGSCCCSGHSGCCCGGGGHGFRRFYTKAERREHLEKYRDQLKKELEGIEEHLEDCDCC